MLFAIVCAFFGAAPHVHGQADGDAILVRHADGLGLDGSREASHREVAFCLQLKQGEIHASTEVAAELAAPGGPMEVQHFGYALLQHLVRPSSCKRSHACPHRFRLLPLDRASSRASAFYSAGRQPLV